MKTNLSFNSRNNMNKEITNANEIKIGDDIVVEEEFQADLLEGKVVHNDDSGIFANLVSHSTTARSLQKIKADQIISLRRGANYFKVSIKQ